MASKSDRVHPIALRDISEWIAEEGFKIRDDKDVWIVTPKRMYNKEQRRLNDKLGVNKVNFFGKRHGFK